MPFDPQPYLDQITNEVGDPNGTVADLLAEYWTRYSAVTSADTELTYLYVKRAALDVRLAEEMESTDIAIGQDWADKQSERFDHIQAMRDETNVELLRVIDQRRTSGMGSAGSQGRVAHGVIAASELVAPPTFFVDANDPRYRGSPYRRTHRTW